MRDSDIILSKFFLFESLNIQSPSSHLYSQVSDSEDVIGEADEETAKGGTIQK